MVKKLFSILLCVLMLFSLCACEDGSLIELMRGGKKGTRAVSDEAATDEPVYVDPAYDGTWTRNIGNGVTWDCVIYADIASFALYENGKDNSYRDKIASGYLVSTITGIGYKSVSGGWTFYLTVDGDLMVGSHVYTKK